MAGHSKWANIKHKKLIKDKKKSKIFSKFINNIKNSTTDEIKLKKAINKALEKNINKKIINKIIKKKNDIPVSTNLLYFKNNKNVIIIIETLNTQDAISEIKYNLNNLNFSSIELEKIIKEINIRNIFNIQNSYNEIILFNKLKKIKINEFIDNNIYYKNQEKTQINNILNTFNLDIKIQIDIDFKNKLIIESTLKKKINILHEKLSQNTNIKNIFINKI